MPSIFLASRSRHSGVGGSSSVVMTSVAMRVHKFEHWLKGVMEAQKRDDSHGMAHFERVRVGALEIASKTSPPDDDESLILQLSALCHDVLDHKYVASESCGDISSKPELKAAMEEALRSLSGLTAQQVDDVCLVSDNVSLSKELLGCLDDEALMARRLSHIRDFVSDADKLDALGMGGIKRLVQYQAHLQNKNGSTVHLSSEFIRGVAQRHILHRVGYLRTEVAVLEGKRLLKETACIMASDAALQMIIDKVLIDGRATLRCSNQT